MILLVGATGRLGRAVAVRLLEAGSPLRAACRDPAKAKGLFGPSTEIVPIDLASGAGIESAMQGATKVITCVHGLTGRSRHAIARVDVEGHRRLIDAAVRADVKRFVYMSALGASLAHPSDFWKAKARTEEYLKASGLDYVILRPSAFMDLYAHDLIGAAVLRGKTVFLLGSGTTPRNMIAVADVAEAAIAALTRHDLACRTLDVGGWDNPTEREVAALYASLTGGRAKVRSVPLPVVRALSAVIGPFHAGIGRLLRLPLQLRDRSDLRHDGSSMRQIGIEPVRLQEFVEGRVSAADAVQR